MRWSPFSPKACENDRGRYSIIHGEKVQTKLGSSPQRRRERRESAEKFHKSSNDPPRFLRALCASAVNTRAQIKTVQSI